MPDWGLAAAPLVEGELVIVQTGGENGACLVAFDRKTGGQRWTALDDMASYSAPIVVQQAGRRVLVCWTGSRVVGLAPETGELLWQHPFKHSREMVAIATPVCHGGRLIVSSFYDGSLMLRLDSEKPAVEKLWHRSGRDEFVTDAVHCLFSTPQVDDEHVYGVDSYGQLRCLEAKSGDRIWEDRTATSQVRWGTVHMVRNGEKTWMLNDRGELIISGLSPSGFEEISRARLIRPTRGQLRRRGGVCWSHPAFAYKHVFARNDEELVCARLAAGGER
jgi:outer membrane protein assembly factor BamB